MSPTNEQPSLLQLLVFFFSFFVSLLSCVLQVDRSELFGLFFLRGTLLAWLGLLAAALGHSASRRPPSLVPASPSLNTMAEFLLFPSLCS